MIFLHFHATCGMENDSQNHSAVAMPSLRDILYPNSFCALIDHLVRPPSLRSGFLRENPPQNRIRPFLIRSAFANEIQIPPSRAQEGVPKVVGSPYAQQI